MKRTASLAPLWAVCLFFTGCLARQVERDGLNSRQALLDIYTTQVIDNLIKAKNNEPFVQLDYKGLLITDSQVLKANLSNELDPQRTNTFNRTTGTLLTAMHTLSSKLGFGGTADLKREMQIGSEPVIGKADIYDYYLGFAHDPSLFCVSETKPAGSHICKKCGSLWYSIPIDASGVFLQLALRTTLMRGPELPPPIYWNTTLAAFEPRYDENGKSLAADNKYVMTFSSELANAKNGYVNVSLADGTKTKILLFKLDTVPFKKKSPGQLEKPVTAEKTAVFFAIYDAKKAGVSIGDLSNRPAQVYLPDNPNLSVESSPELDRLNAAVANYNKLLPR